MTIFKNNQLECFTAAAAFVVVVGLVTWAIISPPADSSAPVVEGAIERADWVPVSTPAPTVAPAPPTEMPGVDDDADFDNDPNRRPIIVDKRESFHLFSYSHPSRAPVGVARPTEPNPPLPGVDDDADFDNDPNRRPIMVGWK